MSENYEKISLQSWNVYFILEIGYEKYTKWLHSLTGEKEKVLLVGEALVREVLSLGKNRSYCLCES